MPKQPITAKGPRSAGMIMSRVSVVAAAYVLTRFLPGLVTPPEGRDTRASGGRVAAPESRPANGRAAGPNETAGGGRGRSAESPTDIPAKGWWDIMWRVYGEVNDDRIQAVAAGVTFYALLALFPAIAAFVSLYGLFADPSTISEQLSALGGLLPGGAIEVIGGQVQRLTAHQGSALGFASLFGLAVSLWSANAGMKAVFDALNVAYDESEKRNFFWLNLWSLGFTLGAILFIAAAFSAVVVLPVVLNFVGLGSVTEWVIRLGRWPALFIIILLGLSVLYRYAPSRDRARWRWVTPGSLLAAVGWMAFSMLFSWYISNFGKYNETYGSLGAAIGFLTWVWLSTTIVLVGAELNAEIEHQTKKDTTEGPNQPLGQRGAEMADTVGRARA
jgi:membrane protein